METYRDNGASTDAELTPVQRGIKRGLSQLYSMVEMEGSSRIDALMKRLEQKDQQAHFC